MRDHYPNTFGYKVVMDLLQFSLFTAWAKGLQPGAQKVLNKYPEHIDSTDLLSTPFIASSGFAQIYPKVGIRAHCLMSMLPQFGANSPVYGVSCKNYTTPPPYSTGCIPMSGSSASSSGSDSSRLYVSTERTSMRTHAGSLFLAPQ